MSERIDPDHLIDRVELPCGCVAGNAIRDGRRLFVMVPCALDCEFYRYTVNESRAQAKPVLFEDPA